ncbi:MAG TPA: aldo/keto reductase [Steroidobacteraceae bacterium]|nr:aldo/keto reductase [Steroidobacteraceae bacterium]
MLEPASPPILKAIPATGQWLPVVGLGTNAFDESLLDPLREGLRHFASAGAAMLDTAAVYGESEQVIGRLVAELGLRERLFIATKITSGGGSGAQGQPGGRASLDRSLARLKTDHVDLLYVHNLIGADVLLPAMLEWRQEGRLRYIGVSTSHDAHHAEICACMRKHPLDFVQVNYGLGGRAAQQTLLEAAADRRVAVVANVPLGGRGGRNLQAVKDRPLPDWAAEIGCSNWAQVMLKYSLSHPAVTCVISGSTRAAHIDDNQRAGRGVLPDAALRRRMEQYWDAL